MVQINPLLAEMQARRRLSKVKIEWLVYVKEFIDRIALEPYTPQEKAEAIKKKYGVLPDLLTWGDYFQVVLAKNFWEIKDEDFISYCQKLLYDLLLALFIFSTKDSQYRQEIKDRYFCELAKSPEERDLAILHEAQLCFYYEEMGLSAEKVSFKDWERYFVDTLKKAV